MTLRWYLSTAAGSAVEITDRVRLPVDPEGVAIAVGTKADGGAGWEGDLLVDDTAGDLIPLMYRRIYAVQDAAPAGAQNAGNWFISNLKVTRKDPFAGAARVWTVTMADENSLLERRKFVGSDSNRPAETDITRLRWALTTTELNVLSPDETYIDTTNPVNLDAANLLDQGPDELMSSLMAASQKHYWIKYEEAAAVGGAIVSSSVAASTTITTTSAHGLTSGQTIVIAGHSGSTPAVNGTYVVTVTGTTTYTIPLTVTVGGTGGTSTTVGRYVMWYANMNTSTLYSSTLSLSNVASEIGVPASTLVYPLSGDAELDRAGGRMASGMIEPYKSSRVYVQNAIVGTTYAYVDRVSAGGKNVSSAAAATAQATRELAQLDRPDDEISTVWTTEAASLNLIERGMRLPVHVTHFPNYTDDTDPTIPGYLEPGYAADFIWCRVMQKDIRQVGPTTFECPLRLSPQVPAAVPCSEEDTPDTTFPPLLPTTGNDYAPGDALGNLFYWCPGVGAPVTVTPNYWTGAWRFHHWNVGGVDYGLGPIGNALRIVVNGAGTLTIPIHSPYGGAADFALTATLYHLDSNGVLWIAEEVQHQDTGTTFTFTITTALGTICTHWVDIVGDDFGGSAVAGYGGGAAWDLT